MTKLLTKRNMNAADKRNILHMHWVWSNSNNQHLLTGHKDPASMVPFTLILFLWKCHNTTCEGRYSDLNQGWWSCVGGWGCHPPTHICHVHAHAIYCHRLLVFCSPSFIVDRRRVFTFCAVVKRAGQCHKWFDIGRRNDIRHIRDSAINYQLYLSM